MATYFGSLETPVGAVGVLAGPDGIARVGWGLRPGDASTDSDPLVERTLSQLEEYFAGTRRDFDLPVDLDQLEGSTRAVLTTLYEEIGYGQCVTYGDLAARSGTGVPARGIGAIMGANPIPIIIGCHRVLSHDGLGGYSGGDRGKGLETKRWLLELEGSLPPMLPFD